MPTKSPLNTELATIAIPHFAHALKPRSRDWYKGLSGHVIVIGGDEGYAGAPFLAGLAALRIGAGLVTVLTHPQHAIAMNAFFPEIMVRAVKDIARDESLLQKASCIILGPGLGQSDWSQHCFNAIIQCRKPMLVDADGLNLLALQPQKRHDWVLTPHPGEAARLLHCTTDAIQADRLAAARMLCERYGGICVLKGAGTLVLQEHEQPLRCEHGNPGMATAGMGDMLSGVIGGLIAQGMPLYAAAAVGVDLHAQAGDLAAQNGERGMIASDLFPYLRTLVNHLHDE